MQYDTELRDAQNNAVLQSIGESPTIEIRGGEMPANCAALDAGPLLAIGTIGPAWVKPSKDGVLDGNMPWKALGQIGAGMGAKATYFRIKKNGVCRIQGSFGVDLEMQPEIDSPIANGQLINIVSFRIVRGNI